MSISLHKCRLDDPGCYYHLDWIEWVSYVDGVPEGRDAYRGQIGGILTPDDGVRMLFSNRDVAMFLELGTRPDRDTFVVLGLARRLHRYTPAEFITGVSDDWWRCVCGNEPDEAGFYPSTLDGKPIHPGQDDDVDEWDTHRTNVCGKCGRLARDLGEDQIAVPVVGVCKDIPEMQRILQELW